MANKKGCWKWAIVGGVSAAVVFAIAMVLGFSLQKDPWVLSRTMMSSYSSD